MAGESFYAALIIFTTGLEFIASSNADRRKVLSENSTKLSRGAYAPRMYYDEWTPLGRGDPLKHDPTYDYVPPLLDHVHYWEEPRRTAETPLHARRDSPDIDTKPQPNEFQVMPEIPPTMLVPPPLPSVELSTRPAPTTFVDVEPVNMVLHSSTTGGILDLKTETSTWRAPNTRIILTTAPTFQQYDAKERPFTRNSLYQQSPPPLKHQLSTTISKPPSSIPIQQGQPFQLPQAPKIPILGKPIKKVQEKESLALLLQSLLDDVPTTTESSVQYTTATSTYGATTTPSPMTTGQVISHYTEPPVPASAPLYLIIQGHSKVKTYGASNAPSIRDIPHNQLGNLKSKLRFSREVESKRNAKDMLLKRIG